MNGYSDLRDLQLRAESMFPNMQWITREEFDRKWMELEPYCRMMVEELNDIGITAVKDAGGTVFAVSHLIPPAPQSALTWLLPRREFVKSIEESWSVDPILYRCRIQQRSDGVAYYMTWQVNWPPYRDKLGQNEAQWQKDRKESREEQWDSYLGNIDPHAKPQPLGIVARDDNGLRLKGWHEVSLDDRNWQ